MANTTNFNWETPDDTDLVKDGALAIRTLGNSIDTTLVDLKGGTTGQVLSKTSNTDMDFTWVTSDDANAIQNAIVDAKGDLIAASAADTPARLAVGNNGETLVADSSQSTGLRWGNNYGFTAGKNKLINGDFRINQRNFTSRTTTGYGQDRWTCEFSGVLTYSNENFTPGSAPVAGYEGTNYARMATSSQTIAANYSLIEQRIEDVRSTAGQTITVSFWARAASGTPKVGGAYIQQFGSGGSAEVPGAFGDVTLSTSWARYSVTATIPSVSGKTIGSGSYFRLLFWVSAGSSYSIYTNIGLQNATIDFWGMQAEVGSVATAFQTATGTLAGELMAAQRYYWRVAGTAAGTNRYGYPGVSSSTTTTLALINNPVPMRVAPTSIEFLSVVLTNTSSYTNAVSTLTIETATTNTVRVTATVSGQTTNQPTQLGLDGTGYIAFSAEL